MTRILLTTTSYQDTPGPHHALLESQGYEIIRERGPLPEDVMLGLVGEFDGYLCGDDAFTRKVLEKCLPRIKVLSKYGIGLDKIDVHAATDLGIPVCFTPGVNHTAVAEHVFGLLLSLTRNIITEHSHVQNASWKRVTGREVWKKTMGVIGLGRIGKEVAKRARGFEMDVVGYDIYWDDEFARQYNVRKASTPDEVVAAADVLSLNMNLSDETRGFLSADRVRSMRDGAIVINCARGGLVDQEAVAEALKSGKLGGYGADVFEPEPINPECPLLGCPNTAFTPHIGSRTYESVERQAMMSTENLIRALKGDAPIAQANNVPLRA